MSKKQDVADLAATGQAVEVKAPRSREEKFNIAIAYYRSIAHRSLRSPRLIEWTPGPLLRHRSIYGTALAPIVTALKEAGEPVEPTMQGVMDALGIDRQTLHDMACYCRHRSNTGEILADQLRRVRDGVSPRL